jgi:hypothetical protein
MPGPIKPQYRWWPTSADSIDASDFEKRRIDDVGHGLDGEHFRNPRSRLSPSAKRNIDERHFNELAFRQ